MHMRVARASRVERTTTSCGECRRRKQRCNQGRPCSNCARRFPQPACEYKSTERRPASHVEETSQGLLPLAQSTTYSDAAADCDSPLSLRPKPPLQMPWPELHDPKVGEVVRWSGIDVPTQFPGLVSSQNPWNSPWAAAPGTLGPSGLPVCDDTCAMHQDAAYDVPSPLPGTQTIPSRFSSAEWHPANTDEVISWIANFDISTSYSHLWLAASPAEEAPHLPAAPTKQDTDLLRIFVNLLSRFKASLDGNPDSSNPYNKYYVPFCLKTPILTQVAIHTAACFLSETGHLDERVAMAHKGLSIRLLNDHLRSESSSSDEVIAAVIQLIVDEWYWGETNDLRAHLRGLREMIRLRGGFRNLGLYGLISRLAIISDNSIALSFEISPFLQDGPEFELLESTKVPLRLAHNTPLVSPLPRFIDCAEALKLHPATASILDDVRFLISTVLALSDAASAKELQKVCTTSAWIHDRISKLPDYSPLVRCPSTAAPAGAAADDKGSGNNGGVEVSDDVTHGDVQQGDARSGPSGTGSGIQGQKGEQGQECVVPRAEPEPPDYLYQSVRLAALMYSRAIMERQPFSSVVAQADFLQLWTTMWRVPLATWKGVLGVFNWAVLPVTPAASGTPHDRSVKSMLTNSTLQMSLDNWELTSGAMKSGLSLQRWLGRGAGAPANAEAVDAASDHGSRGSFASSHDTHV